MARILVIIPLLLCLTLLMKAQQQNSSHLKFNDGIYFSFDSLKQNKCIKFSQIINIPTEGSQFAHVVMMREFQYHDEYGLLNTIKSSDIWGTTFNNSVYIQMGQGFSKIEILGALSYFSADVEVLRQEPPQDFNANYNMPMQTQTHYSVERKQFLLLFETGKIVEIASGNIADLIKNDTELHAEYMSLSFRKRKKMFFYFLVSYNKRNPISFVEQTNSYNK